MNIAQAKEEIKNTVRIYTRKNEDGSYKIAPVHQRPVLLIGPPGIGKTAIMEQVAKECEIGLVAYTITHHTRQSAVGLPLIKNEVFGGKEYAVTEYTMSEIIASVYQRRLHQLCFSFFSVKHLVHIRFRMAGSLWQQEIRHNTINQFESLIL